MAATRTYTNRDIKLTRYATPQRRHNMYLPAELVEGLKEIAARRGISFAEVIKRTMTSYLKQVHARERG